MNRKDMLRERELLENKIQDLVLKFEENTSLSVVYVEVRHEPGVSELSIPWVTVEARLE